MNSSTEMINENIRHTLSAVPVSYWAICPLVYSQGEYTENKITYLGFSSKKDLSMEISLFNNWAETETYSLTCTRIMGREILKKRGRSHCSFFLLIIYNFLESTNDERNRFW